MKKLKYYKTWETVTGVDEFALTGAIIRARCSCGLMSGQPVIGKPKDFQDMIGKKLGRYCTNKAHAKVRKGAS